MKNAIPIMSLALLAPLTTVSLKADTLALYTFETSQPATAGPFSPETGSGSALSYHSGATFPTTTYSSPAGNGSAHSFSANGWSVGDYYQFEVGTLGYSGITISFDQTSSNTGPRDYEVQYSTDGSSFTDYAAYSVLANASPNPAWNATTSSSIYTSTYDLSSVTGLNNQASVYFRLVDVDTVSANAGTVASAGTDRVDNFAITATAVPEPGTLSFALLGGLALFGLSMRRMRS